MTMIAAMGNQGEFDTDTEVVQDLLLENRHFTAVFTPLHVIFLLKSNSRSKLNKPPAVVLTVLHICLMNRDFGEAQISHFLCREQR